jgi:guanylate kinase
LPGVRKKTGATVQMDQSFPRICAVTGPGTLFIISAPSGAGKTTLVHALLESMDEIEVSVSHTTRPPRPGEVDGRDYYFVPRTEFERLRQLGALLESAQVFENLYGTLRETVTNKLAEGIDVVLEIDWQGAQQVTDSLSKCVTIFILPPSRRALQERLANRGQDSGSVIDSRMAAARNEMAHWREYQYLVVNEDFARALGQLRAIVTACRLRTRVQASVHAPLIETLLEQH